MFIIKVHVINKKHLIVFDGIFKTDSDSPRRFLSTKGSLTKLERLNRILVLVSECFRCFNQASQQEAYSILLAY